MQFSNGRWKRDPVVSASGAQSGGPWLESRSWHLQSLLDSVFPSVHPRSLQPTGCLLVGFVFFFFLNYLFLITVIEWSTLKVAGKEKCALNLQTFTFSNATGQSTVLIYTKLIYLMFCFFLTVKAEFSHTCIYKLEILNSLS